MKNIQNLIKNKPVEYVEGMNHLYSNGPKPKGDVVQQLLDLKEWSQNPERYERRLNFRAGQAKKKEQAEAKEKKQIKVVKKPLPKDWQPKYLNGNVIDITPLINDPYWLIKPEKPEDEDTSIPIEEKIRHFAQAKQNNTEQVGVASLLGIPKRFNR